MSVRDFFGAHRRVVVIDTEFTSWEGFKESGWKAEGKHREIFQISAIIVDLVEDTFVDSYTQFVYPRKNPLLSDYARELTGIAQQQVDVGIDFREMYVNFMVFASGLPICSYARTAGREGEGEIFRENIALYKLAVPYDPSRFINLVPLFAEAGVDVANISSGQLHNCFDVPLRGHLHNASHDVESLAVSLIALRQEYYILNKPPRS